MLKLTFLVALFWLRNGFEHSPCLCCYLTLSESPCATDHRRYPTPLAVLDLNPWMGRYDIYAGEDEFELIGDQVERL